MHRLEVTTTPLEDAGKTASSLSSSAVVDPDERIDDSQLEEATVAVRSSSAQFHRYEAPASRSAVFRRTVADDTAVHLKSRVIGGHYLAQFWRTSFPLILADLMILAAALAAARQIVYLFGGRAGLDLSDSFLPIATGLVLLSGEFGLYPGIRLSPVEELRRLFVAVTCIFAVWTVGLALTLGDLTVQRWFLLLAFGLCVVGLPVSRAWVRRLLGKARWWGFPTLLCGDSRGAVELYQWLKANPQLGLRPVGVIADPVALEIDPSEEWYLGDWSDAAEVASKTGAYWALVVPQGETTFDEVGEHLGTVPHIQIISELTGLPDQWTRHQPVDGLTGIHLQQNLLLPLPRITKRVLDLVISTTALLLLSPLLIGVALAVKLTSRGPVFYGHSRIGQNNKPFRAWKFRTMVTNADQVLDQYLQKHPELRAEWERDHKLKWDPRITTVGRFFRKTSLDELPQLWNVLVGDMTLVGPRPIVTEEICKYGDHYWLYTIVKPGITGLWQVSGRNNTTYEERVQLDTYYVRNWSPWLDIHLLLRTVRTVLFAEGAY